MAAILPSFTARSATKLSVAVTIVPFLISVYYIYLLRQNFKQIPDELYYAAKVDGTSDFKYLIKNIVPNVVIKMASIFIIIIFIILLNPFIKLYYILVFLQAIYSYLDILL